MIICWNEETPGTLFQSVSSNIFGVILGATTNRQRTNVRVDTDYRYGNLLNKCCPLFVPDDSKFPTSTGTWMHQWSRYVCQTCPQSEWLLQRAAQTTTFWLATLVKNKIVTGKTLFVWFAALSRFHVERVVKIRKIIATNQSHGKMLNRLVDCKNNCYLQL